MTSNWRVPFWVLATGLSVMSAHSWAAPGTSRSVQASLERSTGRIVFAQVPLGVDHGRVASCADGAGPGDLAPGSRIVTLDLADSRRAVTNITPEFAAAGRPEVSFEAGRILFVGRKRPGDRLDVWEMTTEGGALHRVTDASLDCLQATYLSTIYTMTADRPREYIALTGRTRRRSPAALFICRLDGSDVRRITFSPFDTTDPLLISDGRLLFSLWSRNREAAEAGRAGEPGASSRPSFATSALYTVYSDGTDVFPFASVHERPAARAMPCEMPDGSIIYVESRGDTDGLGGSLVSVPRTRSLHSRRMIADDAAGQYHSPSPFAETQLLASFRPAEGESYGIFLLDSRTGKHLRSIYDDPCWHDVHARRVRAREEPAGRSSVVDATERSGELYCLDAYISDDVHVPRVDRGRIDRLRIIQAITAGRKAAVTSGPEGTSVGSAVRTGDIGVESGDTANGPGEVTLAEVPVESDGSFFLTVPARTPMRLETLDSNGAVLRAMKTWFWVMPGERRGCIGCHENRELTPPNRHVSALRKAPHQVEPAASLRPGAGGGK